MKVNQADRQLEYVYSPLVVTSGIEVKGNVASTQEYDIASGLYTPDYTTENLVVAPWVGVTDPDDVMTAAEKVATNIVWNAIEQGVKTLITATTAGYALAANGQLTVKRNVQPDYPLTLVADFDVLDTRTGMVYHKTESHLVTCESVSSRPVLTLDCPSAIRYDPLRDGTPVKKVKASLRVGTVAVTSPNVRFVWHKRDYDDMTWSEVSASELMDYDVSVSADGTELSVNCEYIGKRIDVRCYALYNPFGSAASLSIGQTTPMKEFSVVRFEATLRTVALGPNRIYPKQSVIKPTAKVFDAIGEVDNADSKVDIDWKTAKCNVNGTLTFGSAVATGSAPSIPTSFLDRRYGGKYRVEASVKRPLKALKTADGKVLVDGQGRVLLAR